MTSDIELDITPIFVFYNSCSKGVHISFYVYDVLLGDVVCVSGDFISP